MYVPNSTTHSTQSAQCDSTSTTCCIRSDVVFYRLLLQFHQIILSMDNDGYTFLYYYYTHVYNHPYSTAVLGITSTIINIFVRIYTKQKCCKHSLVFVQMLAFAVCTPCTCAYSLYIRMHSIGN